MKICDSFLWNGKCYAACSGTGITKDMQISKIMVQGAVYEVMKIEIKESFSGHDQAMLEVNCSQCLPNGEIMIL